MRTPVILVAALLLGAPALFAQRGVYENTRHGFSLKPPRSWSEVPIKPGEEWILAKFLSDKKYSYVDEEGSAHFHQPMLQVVGFPLEREDPEEDPEDEEEESSGVEVVFFKNPYKNYEDYLDRHHQGGGWFFELEERSKIEEMPVVQREVKVEKLTNLPRRVLSFEYELQDGFYVVQVDVLENHYKRLRRSMEKVLRSFRPIKKGPSGEQLSGGTGSLAWVWGKDAAEMRKKLVARRVAWRQRVVRYVKETMPQGWKAIEDENFLVITHASPRFTKSLHSHAKHMRKWLDEEFGDLGEGEVTRTVIRICESNEEESAYRQGSGQSFVWDSGEVVCAQGAWALGEYGYISRALTHQFLYEKNPSFYDALPWWYSSGLTSYVGSALPSKKKKLVFVPNTSDLITLRKLQSNKELPRVEMLFAMTTQQMQDELGLSASEIWSFARYFTRYLIEAPDKRVAFGREYLEHLIGFLDEFEADKTSEMFEKKMAERPKKPMSEAEEDEWFKEANKRDDSWKEAFEADRRAFLQQSYEDVFGKWSQKDWDKVQREFERYLGS